MRDSIQSWWTRVRSNVLDFADKFFDALFAGGSSWSLHCALQTDESKADGEAGSHSAR